MNPRIRHPKLTSLLGVILVVAALYFAKDVLVLVAMALLLAFLLAPLVARLQRIHLGRVPAVVVVLLFALVILGGFGWIVFGEVNQLIDRLPEYRGNFREKVSAVTATIKRPLEKAQKTVADITTQAAESQPDGIKVREVKEPDPFWAGLVEPVGQIAGLFASFGIILLLAGIMLIQKEDMRNRLIRLASGGHLSITTQAIDEASAKMSRYLLATSLLNGAHGICVGVGLALIGIPNAILWGLMSAVLRFIPYVGPWVAAAMPITLAVAISPPGDWTMPLMAAGLIAVLELVSNNVLEPWIYGTKTGISPGAVIIAAIFWTWIWGAAGLFLATPLTVCLAVLGKYVPPLRFLHVLLGDEPVLSTEARLYQRLLANDADEAWEIVSKELAQRPRIEVFDKVLLPALAFAERERHDGSLDSETFDRVAFAIEELTEAADEFRREGEEPMAPLPVRPTAVLCVGAVDEADQAVAVMAQKLLRRAGYAAEIAPRATRTTELPDLVKQRHAKLVLLSIFPPAGFARVRTISRVLSMNFDGLSVIVGVWGTPEEAQKTRERLPAAKTNQVVATLAEALGLACELHPAPGCPVKPAEPEPRPGRASGADARAQEREPHAKVQAP